MHLDRLKADLTQIAEGNPGPDRHELAQRLRHVAEHFDPVPRERVCSLALILAIPEIPGDRHDPADTATDILNALAAAAYPRTFRERLYATFGEWGG